MLNSIDAIIFDLGGVVLNLDYNRTIHQFQLLGQENFEKLYTQSQQDKIFDRFETGEISASEFRAYMKGFLGREVSDTAIDFAWNAMLLDLPRERIELIERLKKTHRIFLFSNTNEIHLEAFRKIILEEHGDADLLDNLFHQTYYSHLVGKRKPTEDAFRTILDEQGLIAEKTLFIDDSIQHVEGSRKIGIRGIHLEQLDILQLFSEFL
jgi:FMN phosphatase YigB (HAD superfamily)